MSASELHRRIIENSKQRYITQFMKNLQCYIQSHEWPYIARRKFAYAILKHMNTFDLPLQFDTTRQLIHSISYCIQYGDLDIPCLELCLDDIIHQRSIERLH